MLKHTEPPRLRRDIATILVMIASVALAIAYAVAFPIGGPP